MGLVARYGARRLGDGLRCGCRAAGGGRATLVSLPTTTTTTPSSPPPPPACPPPLQTLLQALEGVGKKHGVSIADVATRWVLERPHVAGVIVGARNASHVGDLEKVFTFELDAGARRCSDGGNGVDRSGGAARAMLADVPHTTPPALPPALQPTTRPSARCWPRGGSPRATATPGSAAASGDARTMRMMRCGARFRCGFTRLQRTACACRWPIKQQRRCIMQDLAPSRGDWGSCVGCAQDSREWLAPPAWRPRR